MRNNSIRVFVLGAFLACCLTHPLHLNVTSDEEANLENGQTDLLTLLPKATESISDQTFSDLDELDNGPDDDYQESLPEIPLRQGEDWHDQDDNEDSDSLDNEESPDKGNNWNFITRAQVVTDEVKAGDISEADDLEEEEDADDFPDYGEGNMKEWQDNKEHNKLLAETDIWLKIMVDRSTQNFVRKFVNAHFPSSVSELKPRKAEKCLCKDPDVVAPLDHTISILQNVLYWSKSEHMDKQMAENDINLRIKASQEEKQRIEAGSENEKKLQSKGLSINHKETNDPTTNECLCHEYFVVMSIEQAITILQNAAKGIQKQETTAYYITKDVTTSSQYKGDDVEGDPDDSKDITNVTTSSQYKGDDVEGDPDDSKDITNVTTSSQYKGNDVEGDPDDSKDITNVSTTGEPEIVEGNGAAELTVVCTGDPSLPIPPKRPDDPENPPCGFYCIFLYIVGPIFLFALLIVIGAVLVLLCKKRRMMEKKCH